MDPGTLQRDGEEDDAEFLDRLRRMSDHVIAELEKQRPMLEAAGGDVDAKIRQIRQLAPHYEHLVQKEEEAVEAMLQATADLADRCMELKAHLRVALDAWDEALARAEVSGGSMAKIEAWEAYRLWKAANLELYRRWLNDYDQPAWRSQIQALIDELESR